MKVENALREMILEVVKEAQPRLEKTLTAGPKYLNVTGAADYLGVSRATFWNLRQLHPLKQYDFDGSVRFKPSDLDAWAEQFKEGGLNMISAWEGILWFIGGILLGLILSNPKKYFDL